jgi:hypothetical protein
MPGNEEHNRQGKGHNTLPLLPSASHQILKAFERYLCDNPVSVHYCSQLWSKQLVAEKFGDEDLLICATMQTLFKGRTVYVAEPEEASDSGLIAGVSRYSFRWRSTALAACVSLRTGCFGKRWNPGCPSKTGMSDCEQACEQ